MRTASAEHRRHRLADLHVPVLVLFGTLDRMIPSEMGRLYCEKLPTCTLILVYDAGHALDADRPEAFVSAVDDFLEPADQSVRRLTLQRHLSATYQFQPPKDDFIPLI